MYQKRRILQPTVFDGPTAQAAAEAAADLAGGGAEVVVKVDCGFGRLGVPLAEAAEFIAALDGKNDELCS